MKINFNWLYLGFVNFFLWHCINCSIYWTAIVSSLQVSTSIEVGSVDEAVVVERDGFIVKRQNNKEDESNLVWFHCFQNKPQSSIMQFGKAIKRCRLGNFRRTTTDDGDNADKGTIPSLAANCLVVRVGHRGWFRLFSLASDKSLFSTRAYMTSIFGEYHREGCVNLQMGERLWILTNFLMPEWMWYK